MNGREENGENRCKRLRIKEEMRWRQLEKCICTKLYPYSVIKGTKENKNVVVKQGKGIMKENVW